MEKVSIPVKIMKFKHSYHIALLRTPVSKDSLVKRESKIRIRGIHPSISNCKPLEESLNCSGSTSFLTNKTRRFTRWSLLSNPTPWLLWFCNLWNTRKKFFKSFEILSDREENSTKRQNKFIRPNLECVILQKASFQVF